MNAIAPLKPLLSAEIIVRETYMFFQADIRTLRGPLRTKEAVWPRQVAQYLCMELLPHVSLVKLAKFFHRDHTSLIHARNAVENRMQFRPMDADDIKEVRNHLTEAYRSRALNLGDAVFNRMRADQLAASLSSAVAISLKTMAKQDPGAFLARFSRAFEVQP